MEGEFLMDDAAAQCRKAQDCADGALIGPGTGNKVVCELNRKQGLECDPGQGKLDTWHGVVKAVEHSDRLEEDPSSGLVARYYRSARALRRLGAYGEGQKTMRAVARRLGETWARPVPIQKDGTRTPIFEIDRVPPVFLGNFRVAVLGYLALLEARSRAKDYGSVKKYRAVGRALLESDMLLFVCFRYDSRRPLVHFARDSQSWSISGFERTRLEFVTLAALRSKIMGIQAALGLIRTAQLLFECTGRSFHDAARGFVNPPSISKKTIFYFILNVAQKSGLFRSFPTLTPRLLEVIFVCRFRGIPIGYEAPRQSEPAGPRGWALLPFFHPRFTPGLPQVCPRFTPGLP